MANVEVVNLGKNLAEVNVGDVIVSDDGDALVVCTTGTLISLKHGGVFITGDFAPRELARKATRIVVEC